MLEASNAIDAAAGQPTIVRCPTIATGLAASLDARGWRAYDETCTVLADLEQLGSQTDPAIRVGPEADEDWLAARSRLNGSAEHADRVFREMTACLVLPRCFAAGWDEGRIVSIAYGVVDRGLLVLEAVGTAAHARRRGWARRTLSALMLWARTAGADRACLQVLAANAPARALYDALGFRTELYRYRYWQTTSAA